jgi:hypothetical protein
MCLLLHVLQPLRDLVWLLRGGPPPGPTILAFEDCEEIAGLEPRTPQVNVVKRDDGHVSPEVIEK